MANKQPFNGNSANGTMENKNMSEAIKDLHHLYVNRRRNTVIVHKSNCGHAVSRSDVTNATWLTVNSRSEARTAVKNIVNGTKWTEKSCGTCS